MPDENPVFAMLKEIMEKAPLVNIQKGKHFVLLSEADADTTARYVCQALKGAFFD